MSMSETGIGQETQIPIKPISRIVKNKLKFAKVTILKISGPDNNFNDTIAAFLATGFYVEPTSGIMFDAVTKSFFRYYKIEPKKEGDAET